MTTKKRELTVKVTYEPNRLATIHVADAYEALLSQVREKIEKGISYPNDKQLTGKEKL